ncbi:hypothetical protein [Shimia sp. MIT910701]|uniref:hypothetical protein n=1 Tax=Shimia sp. MIT910701 TaxID=3096987 RepID=UPI00399A4A92
MSNPRKEKRPRVLLVELEYAQISQATIFVELGCAEVSVVTPDGEVLFTQGVLAGRYEASQWLPFMEPQELLRINGHFTAVAARRGRTKRVTYGEGATKTGANPLWRPRTESKFEREMRRTIGALTARVHKQDEELLEQRRERRRERRAELQARQQPVEVVEEVEELQEPPSPAETQ